MKVYIVKTPLSHDNEDFQPGDEIELADKHAEPLLERLAIEDPAAIEKKVERKAKKVEKKK